MFGTKTLFVLGAGASKELNLPTGAELKVEIAKLLNFSFSDWQLKTGDRDIFEALKLRSRDAAGTIRVDPLITVCHMIRDAMPIAGSIDTFIDTHQGDDRVALCGKLGIVRSIIDAERRSLLRPRPDSRDRFDFNRIEKAWYSSLFPMAFEGVSSQSIERAFENLSFIVFNYDRCLEHLIVEATKTYFGMSESTAQAIAQGARILHPYGVIGKLPWQSGEPKVPFGSGDHHRAQDLLQMTQLVKTFTEREHDAAQLAALRSCVADAETIVFLGFAFHPLNLDLIAPHHPVSVRRVYASTINISASSLENLRRGLTSWLVGSGTSPNAEIFLTQDLSCADLFHEHRYSLTGI